MDKDIIIAVVLSVIVIVLSFLGNRMLMGIFIISLIAVSEIGYKVYLKIK